MEHGHGPTSSNPGRRRPGSGKTGVRGVYPSGTGRFIGRVRIGGRLTSCDTFDTIEETKAAVRAAEEAEFRGQSEPPPAHRSARLEKTRARVLAAWGEILASGNEPTMSALSAHLPDLALSTLHRHRRDLARLELIAFDAEASRFGPGKPIRCDATEAGEKGRRQIEARTAKMREIKADRGERRAGSWELPEIRDPRSGLR